MKILIAGEGGQGAQSMAEILALAANKAGLQTSYIPNFGVEQRGGVSLAFVQISEAPINYPKFDKAGILVVMCDRAISVIEKNIADETLVIFDSSFVDDRYLQKLQGKIQKYLSLPAKSIAQQKYDLKVTNMIILGAVYHDLPEISKEIILAAIEEKFANHPEFKEKNLQAFEEGLNYAAEKPNQQFKGRVTPEIKTVFEDDQKSWQRFPQFCKGCMLCAVTCPKQAIRMSQDLNFLGTTMPEVDLAKCEICGICQKICPDGAIKVNKK